MEINDSLNIEALTPSRQVLLTDALAGNSVDLAGGQFTDISKESLAKIGLTAIEITALEQANKAAGANVPLRIAESTIASSANNPFSKEKWNLERQRHLHDTDPAKARALMREAGFLK